ncbi:MAG: hypothetical protein E2O29_01610 [Deltaproteobacteria bacterium]|nr:MAG: hypothetical protein E2O29_01610 [Deltaproteobacteria bacterium]
MPYLPESFRWEIEETTDLKHTARYFASLKDEDFAGAINYQNHVICKKFIEKKGIKYWRLALVVGTLLLTILELVRRVVTPYEDEAIKRNGDV